VRDCAALHLLAMVHPAAKGERFICCADGDPVLSLPAIAELLKAKMGAHARRVTTRRLPDWIVGVLAVFSSEMAAMKADVGGVRRMTNEKARNLLGWKARSAEEAVLATAESIVSLGLLTSSGAKKT
jgi:nucleoside-diphosphate-sugar epimerase